MQFPDWYQSGWRVHSKHRMSILLFLIIFCVVGGTLALYLSSWSASVPTLDDAVWQDKTLPVETRVQDLLSHMTLAEKIGQMALVEKNSVGAGDVARYGLGGVLSGAGAKPATNTPAGWATMTAEYQAARETSRLQIPILYGVDAIHGHALVPGATVFPHQIGLGASGDAELVAQVAAATAADLAATGVNWNYAPNLDLPQDIRWGRTYEAFGDDPILVGRLGAAYVRGLQSNSSVLATLKHYVGLGAMQWDTSTNENFKIDQAVTPADRVMLSEKYAPPFKKATEAGAMSVMVGLNTWDGKRVITSHSLITDELKTKLGFTGFVVSDWYGVYEGRSSLFLATVEAVNAGVDMAMLPFDYKTFIRHLTIANRLGLVSNMRIDDAVRRILRAKFTSGLFDSTGTVTTPNPLVLTDHSKLARQAVAQSLVLLKNDNATLPISSSVRHIRVAGSAADNVGLQSGAWTVEWQGVDGNWLPRGTSLLDGIKARASLGKTKGAVVEYNVSGTYQNADTADVGIAIVGETPYAEGWGDRAYPTLSEADLAAIKNLQTSAAKVVVIIVSGRPLLIANEVDSWDALVAAWLPGTEGAGVADVLFGDRNFMGTLPLPWPRASEQLPLSLCGTTADGTAVLFPRYSGLSY